MKWFRKIQLCVDNLEGAHQGMFYKHVLLPAAVDNTYDGAGIIECENISHDYMLKGLASKIRKKVEELNSTHNGSDLKERLEQLFIAISAIVWVNVLLNKRPLDYSKIPQSSLTKEFNPKDFFVTPGALLWLVSRINLLSK